MKKKLKGHRFVDSIKVIQNETKMDGFFQLYERWNKSVDNGGEYLEVFIDEFNFQLCPDKHRRRVWKWPGQRAEPTFTIAGHTDSQQGALQDNAKPLTTRVAMNGFKAYQTLPLPAISPDASPVEHVWDMMGRRLHLPGNVDDLT
ncbi:transposable element Tc1 transposase [Trichonephila clavipes]|nr:transposable element Tc1 transposase [Trichonephila clavipes]